MEDIALPDLPEVKNLPKGDKEISNAE